MTNWSNPTSGFGWRRLDSIKIELRDYSSHLNEPCYIWSLWRVDIHDMFVVKLGPVVLALCSFFDIFVYPSRESLCLKLLPQFSSHLNETCYAWSLFSVDVHDDVCGPPRSSRDMPPFFHFLGGIFDTHIESSTLI